MFYGDGFDEDLAAMMQYVRRMRIPPSAQPPRQRRRLELPPEPDSSSSSEDEVACGDIYFTLAGDEEGMPLVVRPPSQFFNTSLMDDYMRNLVRFLPSYDNLNNK